MARFSVFIHMVDQSWNSLFGYACTSLNNSQRHYLMCYGVNQSWTCVNVSRPNPIQPIYSWIQANAIQSECS